MGTRKPGALLTAGILNNWRSFPESVNRKVVGAIAEVEGVASLEAAIAVVERRLKAAQKATVDVVGDRLAKAQALVADWEGIHRLFTGIRDDMIKQEAIGADT